MPSTAISAQGSVISIDTGTPATPTWVVIKNVISFDGFDGSASEIDVTDLASTAMEYVRGLQDMGKFAMTINIDRTDPGQMAVEAARVSGAVRGIKLVLPNAKTAIFNVLVKATPMSGGVNAVLKGSIDTKITGPVVWT